VTPVPLPRSMDSRSTDPVDPIMLEAASVAKTLAAHWRRGLCCRAEELLAEHPALRGHAQAAVHVIYEEVCQRQERGEDVSLTELRARFPLWEHELGVVLDCHRLLGLVPRFPDPGGTLGEFRLIADLGRGGHGRVYLAEQAFLTGRLMVLKVTGCREQEHLKLARLQHTHIVPLYSVRDFPDRNLRILCMPCLGGATLQQLLRQLRAVPRGRLAGRDLLEALRTGVAHPRLYWLAEGPNRRFLERAAYVEAVCWVGVCLADALHYAHEQGLVHFDVKPSNVLLTADCQPMLLDFHLAREPIRPHGGEPEWLGGTPRYMSPEQRAACRACHNQQPIDVPVDARSDVYSLGLLLREALYGEPPAEETPPAGWALPPRPDLSPGLRDVLARCLNPDLAERYPSAAAVAEDLRRHLTHRRLVGVRNRSIAERWRKWNCRRPHALLVSLLVAACAAAVAALGLFFTGEASGRLRDTEEALAQGRRQAEQRHYAEAVATFDRGLVRLGSGPAGDSLRAELRRQRGRAARAHDIEALHEQVERDRYLHGAELLAPATLQALDAHCRAAWAERDHLLTGGDDALDADREEQVRRDLLDVALLGSECRLRLAAPAEAGAARRDALRVLDEAESLFGPSPVLSRERRVIARDTGAAAEALGGADDRPPPQTAWEHYALGRWLLHAGDLNGAAEAFDRAVDLRPQDFWPWFGKGLCAHRRQRPAEAVTAFSVCIALAPDSAACYHNRALALASRGDAAAALRDYDRALRLDPGFAAAALNRGALRLQEGQFVEAEADFRVALTLGADAAAVHFNLALLHQARQEPAAALISLERALEIDPGHRPACELRDRLRKQPAPAAPKPK